MVDTTSTGFTIPPLENGDRLNRFEFERRYAAMPTVKKAELIEGTVYMPAALRFKSHGEPHGWLVAWLVTYAALTLSVACGDAPAVRLDLGNELQPDAILRIDESAGGQSRLSNSEQHTFIGIASVQQPLANSRNYGAPSPCPPRC